MHFTPENLLSCSCHLCTYRKGFLHVFSPSPPTCYIIPLFPCQSFYSAPVLLDFTVFSPTFLHRPFPVLLMIKYLVSMHLINHSQIHTKFHCCSFVNNVQFHVLHLKTTSSFLRPNGSQDSLRRLPQRNINCFRGVLLHHLQLSKLLSNRSSAL